MRSRPTDRQLHLKARRLRAIARKTDTTALAPLVQAMKRRACELDLEAWATRATTRQPAPVVAAAA